MARREHPPGTRGQTQLRGEEGEGGNTGQHPLCPSSAQLRATPSEDGGGGGARSDQGGLGTARWKPKASRPSHLVLRVSSLLSRADRLEA